MDSDLILHRQPPAQGSNALKSHWKVFLKELATTIGEDVSTMLSSLADCVGGWIPRLILIAVLGVPLTIIWFFVGIYNVWLATFCSLVVIRYARLMVHGFAYCIYRPAPLRSDPYFGRFDVTVIVPTLDPNNPDFLECIRSIIRNRPHEIVVVTVGSEMKQQCRNVLLNVAGEIGDTSLTVTAIARPSKRRQIAHVMSYVSTAITVLADDHVCWTSQMFLPHLLAAFDDPDVGAVATRKHVRRTTPGKWTWSSILNFIACNYLERHNWELQASNALDGGVFVVSGRTAAYKTEVLGDTELMRNFCNERFFFGLFGGSQGLGPDDDNMLTRTMLKKGYKIVFQSTALIETTLGEWPKFNGQLLRWARTTFRSNPVMLRDPKFLWQYTWTAFMVYLVGITNFAILWDGALLSTLIVALKHTEPLGEYDQVKIMTITLFAIWLVSTKVIKIIPTLGRNPRDCLLIPVQVIFAYAHSFYKLWALLTFWDCDWSGRNLNEVDQPQDNEEGFELSVLEPPIQDFTTVF